jgi:pimeloyl-ACP methyl ester carboxylesterase
MGDFGFDTVPVTIQHEENSTFTETYGFVGSQGLVVLEGIHFIPRDHPSNTVVLMMHPSSTLQQLPIPRALAEVGIHLMCCGSRYPKNDTALIMEKVTLDLGAYVRHAKEELGYENVVLLGWSGGGSLSLFYQAEAEDPTITDTPAGDPVDLTAADLVPADAVMFIAAHASRALTLTEWMDASVRDEINPEDRDPELDIYNPNNPNHPPFNSKFLLRYRNEQIVRNRKITTWVKEVLAQLKRRDDGEVERGFVVHRTMADPRWIDPAVDPNERKPNWCYLGNPRTVNNGPAGLARFCTLRSWLSQWSYDESRVDGIISAQRVSVPFLTLENGADDACPASHARMIFDAAASANKEMEVIKGAGHYYKGQPEKMNKAVSLIINWLERQGLIDTIVSRH